MEYTTLGKTGLRVSRMGFGGIPIQKVDASVTRKLMERLAERGVNYIDTARGYTVSESFLGEALEGGLREKLVLATKSMSRTKEAMAQDIETSLHNLRTDYIDLYQIHNPSLAELEQVTAPGGALLPGQSSEEALRRLSQYEDLRASLEGQLASTLEKLDSLRAQGRTRSATYQQLLAQKLTLKDFLSRIDLFVR